MAGGWYRIEQGIEQGKIEGKIEVAKALLSLGDDIERVSKATGLTIEEIQASEK